MKKKVSKKKSRIKNRNNYIFLHLQLKFAEIQSNYLIQTLVFLAEFELKKKICL